MFFSQTLSNWKHANHFRHTFGSAQPATQETWQRCRIERALGLTDGWMDTPPSYTEIHGDEDARAKLHEVAERLPDHMVATATRLIAAIVEPPANTTTRPDDSGAAAAAG